MRILIADDNQMMRRGVRSILSSETRHEVCGEAADGAEAIRLARELLPDLILLDISMPGQNGLEVSRLVRQQLPTIKIIIMSQHDAVRLLPRALSSGAHGCVDKSCLATDLLATIQGIEQTVQGT